MRLSKPFTRASLLPLIGAFSLITCVISACMWAALNWTLSNWTSSRAQDAVRIAQAVSTAEDWSGFVTVPRGRYSEPFQHYQRELRKFERHYFSQPGGDLFLSVVDHGEELTIDPGDSTPFDSMGPANPWEVAAYKSGRTTYNDEPFTDETGTYIGADAPVFNSKGDVIGILGATYDSSTLADIRDLAGRSFLAALLPAASLSMLIVLFLARVLTTQAEVLKQIDDAVTSKRQVEKSVTSISPSQENEFLSGERPRSAAATDDAQNATSYPEPPPRNRSRANLLATEEAAFLVLTPAQRKVADLLGRGLPRKAIAAELQVTIDTVKTHIQDIRHRSGLTTDRLAIIAKAFEPESREGDQG